MTFVRYSRTVDGRRKSQESDGGFVLLLWEEGEEVGQGEKTDGFYSIHKDYLNEKVQIENR